MQLFLQSAYLSSALSMLYIALLYRSHPSRRLPIPPILTAFIVGMVAVVPVVLMRRLMPGLAVPDWRDPVLLAPLIEEAVKLGLFALTVRRLGYPTLIEPVDYAILFGILGIGFGIYEDFWYIFGSSYPSWLAGDEGRFLEVFRWMTYARSFPGHVLFNALAGFVLGWGLCWTRGLARWKWSLAAFGVACFTHGLFNWVASQRGTLLLWSLVVLYVGVFVVTRRAMHEKSLFAALPDFLDGGSSAWPHDLSPTQLLFAEGYAWPGRPTRRLLSFFPLTLSLVILFPVLVSCIYFLQRIVVMGWGTSKW